MDCLDSLDNIEETIIKKWAENPNLTMKDIELEIKDIQYYIEELQKVL